METFKHHPTFQELTKLYALMYDPGDVEGFWHFFRVYRRSDIYKLPCGVLRIEPYPLLGAATIHGIFHGNPFYHIQLIRDVLDSYMKERPWLSRLECILPNETKGLIKLAHKVSDDYTVGQKNTVFYWR